MRIISQGGHADLPYERTQLCSNTENVMARCDGKEYLMGSYATHEKAIKAMELCRNKYLEYDTFGTNMFPFEYPKVFQFPEDEKVKV